MKPAQICNQILQTEKIKAILAELSSHQIKTVLKEGGVKIKLPAGYVSQQKRRGLWTDKICAALENGSDEAAAEMLQQWLLNHRRPMLIDLLDHLGVKHRQGETDVSFLVSNSAEKLREAATWLMTQHEPVEVVAYLRYIAHQQRANVFDGWDGLNLTPAAVPIETAPD